MSKAGSVKNIDENRAAREYTLTLFAKYRMEFKSKSDESLRVVEVKHEGDHKSLKDCDESPAQFTVEAKESNGPQIIMTLNRIVEDESQSEIVDERLQVVH